MPVGQVRTEQLRKSGGRGPALALLAAIAVLLAACVTPTPYQSAESQKYGYSDDQIETNRYKVSFYGNTLTEQATVADYMLYRAAELTLAKGYDYFVITDRNTEFEQVVVSRPYYDSFYSPFYFHRGYHYGYPYFLSHRYHPFYFGGYYDVPAGTRYRSTAEIVLNRGEKPAGDENAYDARNVIENIGPRLVRPQPAAAE